LVEECEHHAFNRFADEVIVLVHNIGKINVR